MVNGKEKQTEVDSPRRNCAHGDGLEDNGI